MKMIKNFADRKTLIRETLQTVIKEKMNPKVPYKHLIISLFGLGGFFLY